eukprot:scaffold16594_cov124-Isochrysis_galbana.AAC.2
MLTERDPHRLSCGAQQPLPFAFLLLLRGTANCIPARTAASLSEVGGKAAWAAVVAKMKTADGHDDMRAASVEMCAWPSV